MSENFSQNKSPEQNIKISVDKILGKDTVLKRKRRSANDLRKENFVKFLDNMMFTNLRNGELHGKFHMNMDDYDEAFMRSIDLILKLTYNPRQLELIYFYLYDRIDIEGRPILMKGPDDQIIPTNNAEDIWNGIQKL